MLYSNHSRVANSRLNSINRELREALNGCSGRWCTVRIVSHVALPAQEESGCGRDTEPNVHLFNGTRGHLDSSAHRRGGMAESKGLLPNKVLCSLWRHMSTWGSACLWHVLGGHAKPSLELRVLQRQADPGPWTVGLWGLPTLCEMGLTSLPSNRVPLSIRPTPFMGHRERGSSCRLCPAYRWLPLSPAGQGVNSLAKWGHLEKSRQLPYQRTRCGQGAERQQMCAEMFAEQWLLRRKQLS